MAPDGGRLDEALTKLLFSFPLGAKKSNFKMVEFSSESLIFRPKNWIFLRQKCLWKKNDFLKI